MKRVNFLWLAGLIGFAVWIWWRDLGWLRAPSDALPLLLAFPLMIWLGSPWQFREEPSATDWRFASLSVGFAFLGSVADLGVFFALSWMTLLWTVLAPRLETATRQRLARLLPLAVLAFPWLELDFPSFSWWCRLSAAWTAESVFQVIGFAVHREGTQLFVQQMPFDVSPACAGTKGLQAMALAGTALCFVQIPSRGIYWLSLLSLPLLAWLANSLRVLVIVASALSFSPEFASGWFHPVSGWVVLLLMFGLLWQILERVRIQVPQGKP